MLIAELLSAPKTRNLTNAGMLTAVVMLSAILFFYSVLDPLKSNDFLYYNDQSGLHMSDFVLFFVSGQMVLQGDGAHAYSPEVQMRYMDALIYPNKLEKDFFLQYPPVTFAVMTPFALLPIKFAYVIWVFLLTLCAGAALIIYLTRCKGWGAITATSCTAYLFCSYPAISAWKHGQPVWLVLAFYLLYLLAAHRRQPLWQGMAIAACTFKPQYGILLGLYALCTKQWRAVGWAAIGVVGMLLVSIAAVGWDNVIHYPRILHEAETTGAFYGVWPEYMICVRALLVRYLTPVQALDVSSGLWMVTAFIDCVLFVFAGRRSVSCLQWAFAVAICASLIFSPHTHIHDTLLLAAAFAVTRPSAGCDALSKTAAIVNRLWVGFLFLYVPLSWPLSSAQAIAAFQKIPFLIYDCLLLALAIAVLVLQWRQRDTKYDAEAGGGPIVRA